MVKFFKSNLFFFLLLTIVVFSLYGKSINFGFTYHDDNLLIINQQNFLNNIYNIPKLFVISCYFDRDNIYYRPILNLSFMIETSIFGLNSKVYHTTNIILFILSLYLMYVFLLKLNLNRTILKFIILLISVHPIFTSTVVWIPARNDTLLAIFIFLSFIFFIKYLEKNNLQNLSLYIMLWTIALFTKETALLIILLFPLFIYCFDYKLNKKELIKNVLIFVPIIIYFYLRNISTSKLDINIYFTNSFQYLENMFLGLTIYIDRLINPINTSMLLYKIQLNFREVFNVTLFYFIFIVIFYKKIIDRKVLLFSCIWFVLCLFTTFLLPDYVYLNHRIIISISSLIIIFCLLIEKVISKFSNIKKYLLCAYFLFFAICIPISFFQQYKYINRSVYWNKAFLEAPKYHAFAYMLSRKYLDEGNLQKSKEILLKAISLSDNRYISDLALIYYREGNFDKAEELYKQSIELGINKAQCYRNLSVIYYKRDNDINKAIEYAKLAVKQEPYDTSYKQYLDKLNKIANEKNNL